MGQPWISYSAITLASGSERAFGSTQAPVLEREYTGRIMGGTRLSLAANSEKETAEYWTTYKWSVLMDG